MVRLMRMLMKHIRKDVAKLDAQEAQAMARFIAVMFARIAQPLPDVPFPDQIRFTEDEDWQVLLNAAGRKLGLLAEAHKQEPELDALDALPVGSE